MQRMWGETQDFQMRAIRPLILVQVNPIEPKKDSSVIISARLYDRDTLLKLPVKDIFMNIVSTKDGHEVWPNSVVRHDTWKMDIEISTKDMQVGHNYLVRVSNNRNQSPQGSAEFKVIKDDGIPIVIFPFIPMPSPDDPVKPRMIKFKKFITQMDTRVCPLCLEEAAGHSPGLGVGDYYQDDPNVPEIPVHFNCRCNFEIIFNDEFDAVFEATFVKVAQVWQAAVVAKKMPSPDILKAIELVSKL